MLWKQLDPRYRALLSRGQQGEALVVEAKDARVAGEASFYGWTVTVRVKFADGSVKDFERFIEAQVTDTVQPGMIVPIRFDPKRRSRVEVDTIALRALQDARRAERAERVGLAVEQAEARLRPIDGPDR
jgi:hypothetical protein